MKSFEEFISEFEEALIEYQQFAKNILANVHYCQKRLNTIGRKFYVRECRKEINELINSIEDTNGEIIAMRKKLTILVEDAPALNTSLELPPLAAFKVKAELSKATAILYKTITELKAYEKLIPWFRDELKDILSKS